jgi:tripartite-type tricarboxylate transporter receptor subunit TctC
MRYAFARYFSILTAVGCLIFPAASEDTYPTKPVRLIVGFAAGGPTDLPARYVADELSKRLGKPVVVQNKAGAGGLLATRDALAQPADGYTLLLCTHFESINVAVYRNPQYKLDDVAPVSLISKYFYGIGLSNSVPAADLETFLTYTKAHSGEISYGTIGPGSAQEIFAHQLERLAGIVMNRVPYRSGTQIEQDLIPGRVQLYVAPMLSLIPLLESKQAKVLGVSSAERLAAAPQVPTLKEQGIDFLRFGWLGVCARVGTPQPIISLLNRHIAAITTAPGYRATVENLGSEAVSSTPAELREIIDQTFVQVLQTVQEFGLQQD